MSTTTATRPTEKAVRARRTATSVRLATKMGAVLFVVGSLLGGTAAPAAAAYQYHHTDSFGFWDQTGSSVWVQGNVDWFRDTGVWRGQYRSDRRSYAVLNKTGCLWVKTTWHHLATTVSWPPSGAANRVSDGYYRACGERGTFVDLGGVASASYTLHATTVCIGFSSYSSYTLRRYESCKKMWS
jgi:hypothetical protein